MDRINALEEMVELLTEQNTTLKETVSLYDKMDKNKDRIIELLKEKIAAYEAFIQVELKV